MRNDTHSLTDSFDKELGKDTKSNLQRKIVFNAFHERPKTMLMVSVETGIFRANICRYVANWRKKDVITKVKTARCIITKRKAGFLTTNPDLIKSNQINIFE